MGPFHGSPVRSHSGPNLLNPPMPQAAAAHVLVLNVSDPAKPETWAFSLLTSWPRADDNLVTLEGIKSRNAVFSDPFYFANA